MNQDFLNSCAKVNLFLGNTRELKNGFEYIWKA